MLLTSYFAGVLVNKFVQVFTLVLHLVGVFRVGNVAGVCTPAVKCANSYLQVVGGFTSA